VLPGLNNGITLLLSAGCGILATFPILKIIDRVLTRQVTYYYLVISGTCGTWEIDSTLKDGKQYLERKEQAISNATKRPL
jgi:hypothetical protein